MLCNQLTTFTLPLLKLVPSPIVSTFIPIVYLPYDLIPNLFINTTGDVRLYASSALLGSARPMTAGGNRRQGPPTRAPPPPPPTSASGALAVLAGQEPARFLSVSAPGQWIALDLGDYRVVPTAYSLRHSNSYVSALYS